MVVVRKHVLVGLIDDPVCMASGRSPVCASGVKLFKENGNVKSCTFLV